MKGKTWLICLLMLVSVFHPALGMAATSYQYVNPGTAITIADSSGTVAMTFSNRTAASGQVSAAIDLGAAPRPATYEMKCYISLSGTHTIGATLEYYFSTSSDNTNYDGVVTLNAALASSDKRRNLALVGILAVDQTTNLTTMIASFRNIYLPQRYAALVFWNATAIPTETSTTKHKCILTPTPWQMQAN